MTILWAIGCGGAYGGTPVLKGGYIQLQEWMLEISEPNWVEEIRAMKRAGMETVIIQWLKMDTVRFFPANAPGVDPAEVILRFADQQGMKIFIGLDFDGDWWNRWDDKSYLAAKSIKNIEFAKMLWKRYGHHRSFAGWYIPHEISDRDLDDVEIEQLKHFLREISTQCKKLSSKALPVAFSAFFAHRLDPYYLESIFRKLLKGSGIDILVVQDGVGVQGWQDSIDTSVLPYMKAFKNVARSTGIKLWGAVENFSTQTDSSGGTTRVPTDIVYLKEQIDKVGPEVDYLVTFDFFHYMSPLRGEKQQRLYDAYLKEIEGLQPKGTYRIEPAGSLKNK